VSSMRSKPSTPKSKVCTTTIEMRDGVIWFQRGSDAGNILQTLFTACGWQCRFLPKNKGKK